jgi:hypothetical protein
MMKNMNPEAMQGMMKMAAEMKDMGMDPASGMGVGGPWEDMMSKMAEKMKDPAMQVRVGAFPDRKIVSSPSLSALRP